MIFLHHNEFFASVRTQVKRIVVYLTALLKLLDRGHRSSFILDNYIHTLTMVTDIQTELCSSIEAIRPTVKRTGNWMTLG